MTGVRLLWDLMEMLCDRCEMIVRPHGKVA